MTAPTADAPAPATRRRKGSLGVMGWAGAALLLLLLAAALLAPAITRYDPAESAGLPFASPSGQNWLGTDDLGRDLFSQLVYGARVSLLIGTGAALVAVAIGALVALVAGYYRGMVDNVLMRTVDLMLAFPFIVLVVVLAAYFGRGLLTTIVVIAVVIWARPAREIRSQVIKVREYEHVTAARAMGATGARVIGRHVLPRVAPLAAVQFVRAANVAVLIEASLSFLGLGDPDRVSWGTTLYFAQARNAFLTDAWAWWILPPGLALTVAILGFAFLGYAIEEWADPRLSGRSAPARPRGGRRRPAPVAAAAERPAGPVLEVQGLTVRYGPPARSAPAVDDVSFTVGPRQVVGLVGESGSGKTTLVTAILGLLRSPGRIEGGRVLVEGVDLDLPRRRTVGALRGRRIALVPQSAMNALNPSYTVLAQIAEAASLTMDRAAAAAKAHEVLETVGITPDRHRAFPHELSGGMRQRAVIAMALVNDPVLLVADEPVTGLDVVTQARILRLLLELRERRGLGILLISHDLPMVARVADELLVMYGGRLVERGPSDVVSGDPSHPYTRLLMGAFPVLEGPRRPLAAIPGEPPDPAHLPEGCTFWPRCPEADDGCRAVEPELYHQGAGHDARCLHRVAP